jgi:polysaccharide biosynthesis transport protein
MREELHSPTEVVQPLTSSARFIPTKRDEGGRAVSASSARTATLTGLTATSILKALRRRQTLALGMALLCVGVAGPAAWFLVPSAKFKAQARLQLVATPPKVLFRTVDTDTTGDDYKRYQNTQLTLVKSQLVLNGAISDKAVSKYRMIRAQVDPIAWISENLKSEFVNASEVMEISLSGDDPVEIAGIVNAVKKAYMEEVVNVDTKRRADRFAKLRTIKEQYAEILKERRDRLRKNAEAVGSDDKDTLALRQQYAMEHMAWLTKELLDIQSGIRKSEARIKTEVRPEESPEERASDTHSKADIDALVDQDPNVARLVGQLAYEEARLSKHSEYMRQSSRGGLTDPSVKKLKLDVAATAKLLKNQRAELRPIIVRELRGQDRNEKVTSSNAEQQNLSMLLEVEERLKVEIKSVSDANRSLNVKTLDLSALHEEVTQLQGTASQVSTEVEAITVELQAPPRVRTIEDAVPPLSRDEKKRFATIGLILVGSFFGGLFGVAFLELQTQKVDSIDLVPAELGLQLVGTLPIVRSRAARRGDASGNRTAKERYWNNVLLESVDATRTMLVHAARAESDTVVMITSAVGSEGKTSLSSHLATSLARSGLRTLLIDADLRSPSIHRLFDLPIGSGLSELLRGEVDLLGAIADTEVAELKILSAGRCDRHTIRLLSQGSLAAIFVEIKGQFDFVIVDSSPVLPVADASLIAQEADAVVFSIFNDVSRKAKVSAALNRLESLGVRVLGAVVTGSVDASYGTYHSSAYYASLPESAADSLSGSSS